MTQIVVCIAVEVCLELIKTDFERVQLKYYNFLRVGTDDLQFDADNQWLVKYYVRKVADLTTFAAVPMMVLVINATVIGQLILVSTKAVHLGRQHQPQSASSAPHSAATTTVMLLTTSLLPANAEAFIQWVQCA